MLRSILAVILGMAVGAFVFVLGLRLTAWLLPAAMDAGVLPRSSTPFLAALPLTSLGAGIAGGLVTASTAARFPLRHARVLAAISLVWSVSWVVSRAVPATAEVFWYALAVGVCGAFGTLLGARLQHRR